MFVNKCGCPGKTRRFEDQATRIIQTNSAAYVKDMMQLVDADLEEANTDKREYSRLCKWHSSRFRAGDLVRGLYGSFVVGSDDVKRHSLYTWFDGQPAPRNIHMRIRMEMNTALLLSKEAVCVDLARHIFSFANNK